MSLMKYSPNISHCSILTYTNTGLEWESGRGTRRALSCFSGRDLSPSFLWCQTNRSLAFSSRPPDHSALHSLEWSIIPQQAAMLSSQQRVRSQVQFRLCWALSLLARCIDRSLWWQSYLSEESLTWGKSLKCLFFSFFLNEMWHQHGATDRLMSLPCLKPGLSLNELQRNRSTGEMLVHFESQEKKRRRRYVDPEVFGC